MLGGTNFVHLSYGMMEQMLLAGYEQVLIDEEIISAAYRIAKGFDVNDYTLSTDLLARIGPLGGHFLKERETRDFYRKDRWLPTLTNRDPWDTWQLAGGKDMRQAANERARAILAQGKPWAVSEEQAAEIERLAQDGVARAQKRKETMK